MTDHVEVPLSQGLVALIDAADAEAVLAHKWSAERDGKTFYAMRNVRQPTGGWRKIKLHAYLTGHRLTDHINGDGLDNRRANLRMATQAENLRNRGLPANNTSGFKGVSFRRQRGRGWKSTIGLNGKRIHLGLFSTPEAAARAYDAAARELFGEFAWLNFPLPSSTNRHEAAYERRVRRSA